MALESLIPNCETFSIDNNLNSGIILGYRFCEFMDDCDEAYCSPRCSHENKHRCCYYKNYKSGELK